MSLSAEHLKELLEYAEAEIDQYRSLISGLELDGHRVNDEWQRDLEEWTDIAASHRELIAIKEAEPVAYEDESGSVVTPEFLERCEPTGAWFALIRKPE